MRLAPKIWTCPTCSAPVISTFVFPKKEWICLECGWLGEFLQPRHTPPTAELEGRLTALDAEWANHAGDFLVSGSRLRSCPRCSAGEDYDHPAHATDEERERDSAVRAWLVERTSRRQPAAAQPRSIE
jgi:rubrerythrin